MTTTYKVRTSESTADFDRLTDAVEVAVAVALEGKTVEIDEVKTSTITIQANAKNPAS